MKKTRRTFIQKLGTAMLTFSPATAIAFDGKSRLKIGVLVPDTPSKEIEHFITGLKLTQDFDQHFSIKEIETRLSSSFRVVKSIKKLVKERVDVIISFANKRVSHHALDIMPDLKVPYLQSGLGVNHCPELKDRPLYFEHTMNYYEAAYFAGQYAAKNYGTTASLVSGIFDTGFDHYIGFQKGFESAGGQIIDRLIIQTRKDINRAIKQVERMQPAVIFSLFSQKWGGVFLDKVNKTRLTNSIKVLSNHPFHLKNDTSSNYQYLSTWTNQLKTDENIKFHRQFRKKSKQAPNAYAMLGYETGELLATSLKSNYRYVYSLIDTLAKSDMKGVRRSLKVEKHQMHTDFQLFKPNGKAFDRIKDTSFEEINYFVPDSGIVSGMTEPYLPKMRGLEIRELVKIEELEAMTAISPIGAISSLNGNPSIDFVDELDQENRNITEVNDALPIAETTIKIYPNPASVRTTIEVNLAAQKEVSVYLFDIQGRQIKAVMDKTIKDAGISQIELITADLPAGAYWVGLQQDGGNMLTEKLIVQH